MAKDKFCPFMSIERTDGNINKVDCRKSCALYTPTGCAMVTRYNPQLAVIENRLAQIIGSIENNIETPLKKIQDYLIDQM